MNFSSTISDLQISQIASISLPKFLKTFPELLRRNHRELLGNSPKCNKVDIFCSWETPHDIFRRMPRGWWCFIVNIPGNFLGKHMCFLGCAYKYFSAGLKYSKNTLKLNNNTIFSNNQITKTFIHKKKK